MKRQPMQILSAALILFAFGSADADTWYRGNTHTHTVICGHADSTPEFVTAWYHDHGYNFLILSEHNHFIDPKKVKMPENLRNDFILIPGVEVTGKRVIHTTAMNVKEVVPWKFGSDKKSEIIQNHVDGVRDAGGHAVVNHPNFKGALTAEDIAAVKDVYMFELFNGHPHVHNEGHQHSETTEQLWDNLLTKGMLMYGVSSDDAHHFQTIAPEKSNPGRGWVMVNSPSLAADVITDAMVHGHFYASNGVFLKACDRGKKIYSVEVDQQRTEKELGLLAKLRGKIVDEGKPGYRIEFIGPEGKVLQTSHGMKASHTIDSSLSYVRAKVTYTQKHSDGKHFEEYYAWGQPVFNDARASVDPNKRIRASAKAEPVQGK